MPIVEQEEEEEISFAEFYENILSECANEDEVARTLAMRGIPTDSYLG